MSVRKILYHNEWWYSVVDICSVLTETANAKAYWRNLKQVLLNEGCEVTEICHRLQLEADDGNKYFIDCANMEGIFRIIQSIQSPKADLFKRWLAQAGNESVREYEDPELILQRARLLYKLKGCSEEWIGLKFRGIV